MPASGQGGGRKRGERPERPARGRQEPPARGGRGGKPARGESKPGRGESKPGRAESKPRGERKPRAPQAGGERAAEPRSRSHRATTGVGGDQVEGRRSVREALVARRRRMKEVWLAGDLEPAPILDEIIGLARDSGVAVKLPPRIDAIARTDSHQGVVARGDALPLAVDDELLADPNAFLIALDGVTDPQNLGAIMRSAESAGATGILLPRRRTVHVTPAVTKAAAGAIEHLPIALVPGIPALLQRATQAGVWTVGLDERGTTDLFDLDLGPAGVLLVLGAEGKGLARLARERCDVIARIPMRGRLASLNVAAAGTLACYEVARRR